MSYQLKLFGVAFSLLASSKALSGDRANNGGGSAEQNIVYAFQYLDRFVQNCLDNVICSFSDQDRTILSAIKQALPDEGRASDLLIFRTGAEENFLLDGAVRVAKTGSTTGSKIIINRDMIYDLRDGKPSAMSIPQAAAVLIHELGHHRGIDDHIYLDLLGAKLRVFLQQSVISMNFDPRLFLKDNAFLNIPFIPSFTVMYLNSLDRWNPNTRLIINDSLSAHDLTDLVLPSIVDFSRQNEANGGSALCLYKDEGGIAKQGRIASFNLLSPRWEQSYFYKPFAQVPLFLLRLNFVLYVVCKTDGLETPWIPDGLLYELKVTFDKENGALVYRKRDHLNPVILERDPFG